VKSDSFCRIFEENGTSDGLQGRDQVLQERSRMHRRWIGD